MYIYIYINMYVYMYVYIYVYISVYICIYVFICVYIYISNYISVYIYIYVYMVTPPKDLHLQASYHLMLILTYVYTSHKHRRHRKYRCIRCCPRMHTTLLLRILFRYIDKSAAEFRPTNITLYVFGKPKLSEGTRVICCGTQKPRVFCIFRS